MNMPHLRGAEAGCCYGVLTRRTALYGQVWASNPRMEDEMGRITITTNGSFGQTEKIITALKTGHADGQKVRCAHDSPHG